MRDHRVIDQITGSASSGAGAPAPDAVAGPTSPPDDGTGRRTYASWVAPEGCSRAGSRRRGFPRRFRRPLQRSTDARVLGGVCGGLSVATGIDVTLVRIGFVLLTLGSGVGVLVYFLAWLFIPLAGETANIFSRAVTDRRGIRLVIAVVPALVLAQVLSSAAGVGFLGSFGWPVLLSAAIALLIRRNAGDEEGRWITEELVPLVHAGDGPHGRWSSVGRIAVGAILGVAGLLVLVLGHPTGAALRLLGGAVLAMAAVIVVFGPWWLSLVRDLMSERQARAVAEERARMAAHVHDSVLQTLALIQRSADDPRQVVRLARSQERELRSWLFEGRPPGADDARTLTEGIGAIQRQVEADHGITVHAVVVGECDLTEGLRALLDATREATVNAAKWSGAAQVSLYAEVDRDAVTLYVRDRGRGFDPGSIPGDRQGIARSIRARVARFGGSVAIRSSPGSGVEVEMSVPRPQSVR
ncbi:MAG TPA: PspC domain-containing protein [Acidimicrobiales bacterium]|nr:PspC domain-containing protein [Acidimicrobiales bacterium]